MEPASILSVVSEVKVALPEHSVSGKPLGRHLHHDPRSLGYPAERALQVAPVRHPAVGLPLKQADGHICGTAHALCAALNSMPSYLSTRPPLTEADAVKIYETATAFDSFEHDGSRLEGSSGLLACKAAQRLGLIRAYHHAFGIDHALEALTLSPVMTGFAWYTSFDSPDPESGLVEIAQDSVVRGGHEVVAHAIDGRLERVWFWNSWGREYGINGRFCMTFETWERLLDDRGDVTVPLP
jgi:hypothetical protein